MSEGRQRILVVDDEESIRRSLRAYLEDEGVDVSAASSGEEALEILSHCHVDAAIVDIRLPGMDGNTFIERANGLCPEMIFVIYTGSVDYKVPVRLRAAGLNDQQIFKKPLGDMSALATSVTGLLRKRRGQ
jgi:CheY-like chemotaxis protein